MWATPLMTKRGPLVYDPWLTHLSLLGASAAIAPLLRKLVTDWADTSEVVLITPGRNSLDLAGNVIAGIEHAHTLPYAAALLSSVTEDLNWRAKNTDTSESLGFVIIDSLDELCAGASNEYERACAAYITSTIDRLRSRTDVGWALITAGAKECGSMANTVTAHV